MSNKQLAIKECRMKFVKNFRVRPNGVAELLTEPITIKWRDKDYNLGRFLIRISGSLKDYERYHVSDIERQFLTVLSIDNRSIHRHPHMGFGKLCLGNVRELINNCIKNYWYAETFEYVLNVLKEYVPNHGPSLEDCIMYCWGCGNKKEKCVCEQKEKQ